MYTACQTATDIIWSLQVTLGDRDVAWKHISGVVSLVELCGGIEALQLPKVVRILTERCLTLKRISEKLQRQIPLEATCRLYDYLESF